MKKEVLVLCDGFDSFVRGNDEILSISQFPPKQNLRLQIDNLSHKILKNFDETCRDLLDIAAFVYYADSSVSRGTNKDVFNQEWSRKFRFVIPVRQPAVWSASNITNSLVELLGFLTEDYYEFEFLRRDPKPEQLILSGFDEASPFSQDADSVLLYSGGMDALTGAIYLASIALRMLFAAAERAGLFLRFLIR